MKVGDYVRTKDYQNIGSRIGKIIRQDGKYYYLDIDEDTQMVWEKDTILTSSPNIIDLIEVGDIVNDEKIIDIGCLTNGPEKGTKVIDYYIAPNSVNYLKNEDIKSIVTKEQFSCMKYKIGE